MRLGALIPAGFLLGAFLCEQLLAGAPRSIAADLAQPLVVVTYWKAFGAQVVTLLLLSVSIACVGYVGMLRALAGASPKRALQGIIALSGISCAAALAWPVIFSSDVYAYAGYGDLALHGISPYAHARIVLHDRLLDAVVWQWGNPPPMCVYGPAFVWIAQAMVALLLPLGASAPLWGFRILSCLALVACGPLAYAAFRRFPQNVRLAAAAGISLNPIALWGSAGGHNDAVVLAVVLAGFALVQSSKLQAGAALVALGALIKAPAVAASAGLLLASWHDRKRFGNLLLGTMLGLALVLAIAAPLEYGVRAHLVPGGKYLPQFSLQYVLAAMVPSWTAIALAILAAGTLAAAGARRLARGERDGAAFLAIALWLLIPNPYPWYALWILPAAFLVWDTAAAAAVIAASVCIVFRYVPDATWAAFPVPQGIAVTVAEMGAPVLLLSAYIRGLARRGRREDRTPELGLAPRRSE